MTSAAGELTADERAELEIYRDQAKRLLMFDGGPELMSHMEMHRHHADEPYIGCVFCRDQFVPISDLVMPTSTPPVAPTKVTYELLVPGSFDEDAKDWRTDYVIRRVATSIEIVGHFSTRKDARKHMLATTGERRNEPA